MTWGAAEAAAPELATKVRARFEATGLGVMATIRRDGSPRISPVEPLFGEGEMWLGMMPRSLKARDLLRDPRVAVHSATADKMASQGDGKVGGRAVHVEDEETYRRYLTVAGGGPELGAFHLFRVEVDELSFLIPSGDHLDIDWWTAAGGLRHVDRY